MPGRRAPKSDRHGRSVHREKTAHKGKIDRHGPRGEKIALLARNAQCAEKARPEARIDPPAVRAPSARHAPGGRKSARRDPTSTSDPPGRPAQSDRSRRKEAIGLHFAPSNARPKMARQSPASQKASNVTHRRTSGGDLSSTALANLIVAYGVKPLVRAPKRALVSSFSLVRQAWASGALS